MGAKPDISEVAWNSQAAEPLVRFMTAYLLKLEPFFLRTILENLRLSREGARMLSVVELVESVAQILKDNGNRELSIDIMIQQFSEKSNRPHPGHEQGLFALFGSLTMLYRISHPIDPRFILLRKPKTPWMTRSRRKTNEARLPIGILVGCFGRYTSEVMKFLSEELEPKPAENEAIDLYDSPLNIYVLIVIGRSQDISHLFQDDPMIEQDFYDTIIEFPFLGPRLEILQKYARSRRPRQFLDVWRDTRDPTQWLTIWVVVTIGGATVVFSIMQIVLAFIQTIKIFH
ncbi:MAG: hypothetical protein LQ343_001704 [Gyalolechia ehrenbergii]|nr:MAG: hypothetical protein LQ343_001704 [Gyalolechia ehrenbergii]